MQRVKVITSNAELEEFLARTDIEVINVDIRSCEQSWFAQEYFTAAVYYDDELKSDYTSDNWTRLEHQYAGMAMQGILSNPCIADEIDKEGIVTKPLFIAEMAKAYAHALVEKLKEEEK